MTYTATAKKWSQGWEVHVDGVGVTQCRTLAQAERQAQDLIETWHPTEMNAPVDIKVDVGAMADGTEAI